MNRRSLLTGAAACALAAGFPVKAAPAVPAAHPGFWDTTYADYMRWHMDHIASCMDLTYEEVAASYRASEARTFQWYLGDAADDMRVDVIKMPAQVGRTETLMFDEHPYNRFRHR